MPDVNIGDTWAHRRGELFELDQPVTGWRCEHITMEQRPEGPFRLTKIFVTLMTSPKGEWATARCFHHKHAAPDPGCTCGYRLCRDLKTIVDFDHGFGAPQADAVKCLLTRVEARGLGVHNLEPRERERGLNEINCVAVQHIRPIFPAYTRSPFVADQLNRTYPGADVRVVSSWDEISYALRNGQAP